MLFLLPWCHQEDEEGKQRKSENEHVRICGCHIHSLPARRLFVSYYEKHETEKKSKESNKTKRKLLSAAQCLIIKFASLLVSEKEM